MANTLPDAPKDLSSIIQQESSLILSSFTADDAFLLGTNLRNRIRTLYPGKPAVINISLTNSDNLLFHACTAGGILPDNDTWVARKRATVKRFGTSSWYMGCKFEGDEAAFARKYMLSPDMAARFAIHGGGVPVRVKNVEGIVAVVVVSGLKQHEDHMVVVEGLQELAIRGKIAALRRANIEADQNVV